MGWGLQTYTTKTEEGEKKDIIKERSGLKRQEKKKKKSRKR